MKGERPQILQALSDEHDALRGQIADLRQFWSEVAQLGQGPKYEEMAGRIQRLRAMLAAHFALEERDGYLACAVDTAPHLSESAQKLASQHGQFLNTLDEIIRRLAACDAGYQCWEDVGVEFENFIERLDQHEADEMALVHKAIQEGKSGNGSNRRAVSGDHHATN